MTFTSLISFRPLESDSETMRGANDIPSTQMLMTIKRSRRKRNDVRNTCHKEKGKQIGTRKGDILWGRIDTTRQLNQRKQNGGRDRRRARRAM